MVTVAFGIVNLVVIEDVAVVDVTLVPFEAIVDVELAGVPGFVVCSYRSSCC